MNPANACYFLCLSCLRFVCPVFVASSVCQSRVCYITHLFSHTEPINFLPKLNLPFQNCRNQELRSHLFLQFQFLEKREKNIFHAVESTNQHPMGEQSNLIRIFNKYTLFYLLIPCKRNMYFLSEIFNMKSFK